MMADFGIRFSARHLAGATMMTTIGGSDACSYWTVPEDRKAEMGILVVVQWVQGQI